MKKYITLAILIALFLPTHVAEAHFLATDKNIGAVLHVDPNDEPIAGSQASFFFEFKDKENKFKPQNCDCTFEIDENGKSIYSQSLFQNNNDPGLSSASVFYTFPQRDVYSIKVIGKPIIPHEFQPFTLRWDFRVDQQANQNDQNNSNQNNTNFFLIHLPHFLAIGLFVVFFLIYFIQKFMQKKPKLSDEILVKSGKEGGEKKNEEKDNGNIY